MPDWTAIASIAASLLTLVGVIITVEHGNRIRDVKTDNKIDSITEDINHKIELISITMASLEKKQDAYNGVIQRMYEAERSISLIEEHQHNQDDDLRACKNALGAWRDEIRQKH